MAHSKQAKKRLRQNEKQRVYNKGVRSEIKTLTKKLTEQVEKKDADGAASVLRRIVSKLDKATKNHIYHRNNAARKKSHAAALCAQAKAD